MVRFAARRSATAADQITARRLCLLFAFCRNLRDSRYTTVNTDYWLPVHWKRILAPGKISILYDPQISSPPPLFGQDFVVNVATYTQVYTVALAHIAQSFTNAFSSSAFDHWLKPIYLFCPQTAFEV